MSEPAIECDVAVIGLGPAGSAAARNLARGGISVVGIERASFPRYKVCGGCLNARALKALRTLGLDPDGLRGVELDRFEGRFGRRRVRLNLPGGLAVSRSRLDAFLADTAADAGARLRFETRCTGLERTASGWRVRTSRAGREAFVQARAVIGADGLSGVTRKASAAFRTTVSRSARIGAGAQLEDPGPFEPGVIYMAVGRGGYVGLTVVEDGLTVAAALEASLVRETGSPAAAARAILQQCRLSAPPGMDRADWKGTPPLSQRRRPVAADGVYLLGDSAGYVEPFTGEGMAWALEGAVELSRIVAEGLHVGNDTGARRWNAAYRKRFGGAQRRCGWIAAGLRSRVVGGTVAGVLGAMPGLAGPVLANLNTPAE